MNINKLAQFAAKEAAKNAYKNVIKLGNHQEILKTIQNIVYNLGIAPSACEITEQGLALSSGLAFLINCENDLDFKKLEQNKSKIDSIVNNTSKQYNLGKVFVNLKLSAPKADKWWETKTQ